MKFLLIIKGQNYGVWDDLGIAREFSRSLALRRECYIKRVFPGGNKGELEPLFVSSVGKRSRATIERWLDEMAIERGDEY